MIVVAILAYHYKFIGLRNPSKFLCENKTYEIPISNPGVTSFVAPEEGGCDYENCPPKITNGKVVIKDLCMTEKLRNKAEAGIGRKCINGDIVEKQPKGRAVCMMGAKKYQDPKLRKIAQELGLQGLNDNEFYLYIGDVFSREVGGEMKDTYGTVLLQDKIAVKAGLDDKLTRLVLAHEYVHYRDFKENLTDKFFRNEKEPDHRLLSELSMVYNKSTKLQSLLAKDVYKNSTVINSEYLAYSCTELNDEELTPYVIEICNKIIDRKKLIE